MSFTQPIPMSQEARQILGALQRAAVKAATAAKVANGHLVLAKNGQVVLLKQGAGKL